MNQKKLWTTLSLINLCMVALLGFILRSKILFPLGFVDYEHVIFAHAQFAFGGWVTLTLFVLFTQSLVPEQQRGTKWYPLLLWGVEFTTLGMLFSFLFQGYGIVSMAFLVLFLLCTYAYSWRFVNDMLAGNRKQPAFVLSVCALASLVLSSAGPFVRMYMQATGSTDAILHRDAQYFYLHFQYNGFFTLAVFALFFGTWLSGASRPARANARRFACFLCASVVPSFFLSLLWHPNNGWLKVLAVAGIVLIVCSLFYFFRCRREFLSVPVFRSQLARLLWLFVLLSFVVKSVLQAGTIFPDLGNAVFGLRPIIIGYLHLVFLGLTTFYILYSYIQDGVFDQSLFSRTAIVTFAAAVIIQEMLLLVQGVGLLQGNPHPVYNRLLWLVSILLVVGALLLLMAQLRAGKKPIRKSNR